MQWRPENKSDPLHYTTEYKSIPSVYVDENKQSAFGWNHTIWIKGIVYIV